MRDSFVATPLGNMAHIEMGQSPDSSTVEEVDRVGVPFLQGNAEFGTVSPSPRFSCLAPMKMCKAGDILVSVRAPVGAMNIADRDYCIGRGLAAIRIAGMSPTLAAQLVSTAAPALRRVAQGTTFEAISKNDLASLVVMAPPLEEREPLRQVFDTLDSTIRKTEAIIEKLEQVKQGLLHDLLTRGIDANGELRPPQSQAPLLYKDSPLGWIPREWKPLPLGELADVARGKFTHRPRNDPAFYGGQYPFIQTGDVANAAGGYVSKYSQTLSRRGITVSQEFPVGTIAITIAANIADTAILAIPMYFPDSVVGAIVSLASNIRFVELSIRRAKPKLDARAPQSAQKNINLQDLRPLVIAVPSKGEQDAIAQRYEALQLRLNTEQAMASKLRQGKAGLVDDLLTGRVRVTPLLDSSTRA